MTYAIVINLLLLSKLRIQLYIFFKQVMVQSNILDIAITGAKSINYLKNEQM
jgi:hypothetical protein